MQRSVSCKLTSHVLCTLYGSDGSISAIFRLLGQPLTARSRSARKASKSDVLSVTRKQARLGRRYVVTKQRYPFLNLTPISHEACFAGSSPGPIPPAKRLSFIEEGSTRPGVSLSTGAACIASPHPPDAGAAQDERPADSTKKSSFTA